ncbi:MAG TPA: carboxypeptidase-like regulatory domain-containing protein, partial [Puia sp.]|nr:carboxypeptidase-like regulatory domain-containing protein [Puia sp.]
MPRKIKVACLVLSLLLCTCTVFAQGKVTGRVINKADDQPVPGATIQLKGAKVVTQSGTDGSFSIDLPGNSGTLVI